MQLMTQAEFARHRGVGKSAVTNWKNAKLLVFAEGDNGKPMVDVARSDAKLNAKIDPMRGRPPTGGTPAITAPALAGAPPPPTALDAREPAVLPMVASAEKTLADERIEHLREQRIGQAMKNAQLAGDLVPLVEAERRVSEVGRAARERMHAWLRSVAERFAAEKDVRAIMALGEEGIDQVFSELASAAERGEFAGDEADDLTPEERAELETVE